MKSPLSTNKRVKTRIFRFFNQFLYKETAKYIKQREQAIGQILDLHLH